MKKSVDFLVSLVYNNEVIFAGVMELADVTDSKSVGSDTVWVRVPPPAPEKKHHLSTGQMVFFFNEINPLRDL